MHGSEKFAAVDDKESARVHRFNTDMVKIRYKRPEKLGKLALDWSQIYRSGMK